MGRHLVMRCEMRFDKIILIGAGKVATDCTRFLCRDMRIEDLDVIESSENQFSMLKRVCVKLGAPYRRLTGKKEITDAIKEEAQGNRLLVISANNRYIFPAELCAEPDIEIINFHYGYLPRYRGMNIPTWVIYNDEPYTGVTWHYVTSEVDRGEIIAQEKIMLQDNTTAYEVVREGMQLGTELFMRFMPELLEKVITGKEITTDETVYLDKHLPQDGLADLNAPIMELYRLLRSFDYGRTGTVEPLKIDFGDRVCSVAGYRRADAAEAAQRIRQDGEELILTESGKELRIRMA